MCSENIYIAGRYNKFVRNLSQSPWIDKDDVRIKHSVQELIEDGLNAFLKFDKLVFSCSGREDVDVRMLGRGRPFVFKVLNPWNPENYCAQTLNAVQAYVNSKYKNQIRIRDLQVVTREDVSKHIKDGEESKTKEYRALCCCSRVLTNLDSERLSSTRDLIINQKTPVRVLHRRSLTVRRRKIQKMAVQRVNIGDFESVSAEDIDQLFALSLVTEAGTYIKEFVHGDFGRTDPSLADLLTDCDTDLLELDVMVSFVFPFCEACQLTCARPFNVVTTA